MQGQFIESETALRRWLEHMATPSEDMMWCDPQNRASVRARQALDRLDAGQYGLCTSCSAPIPEAILSARAEAERCPACDQSAPTLVVGKAHPTAARRQLQTV